MSRQFRSRERSAAREREWQHQLIREVLSSHRSRHEIFPCVAYNLLRNAFGEDAQAAKTRKDLGHLITFDLNEHNVPWARRFLGRNDRPFGTQAHHACHLFNLTNRDSPRKIRHNRSDALRANLPALAKLKRLEITAGFNFGDEPSATRRIKTITFQLQCDVRPHPANERKKCAIEKVERRSCRIVSSTFDNDSSGRVRAKKGRQNRLEHKCPAARRAHSKAVFARANNSRRKRQCRPAERSPFDVCRTNLGSRTNGGQMLSQQPGVLASRANVFDLKRNTGRQRKAEGGS